MSHMSQQKRNAQISSRNSSLQSKQEDEAGKEETSSILLIPPQGNNRDEWKAYWQAQGQPWRTEPEISTERQVELKRCREAPAYITKNTYPFKGVKLDRPDVEWLLATHDDGWGPILWSDEYQRIREGLDLRGADLSGNGNEGINLHNLPLARLRGGLTLAEMIKGDMIEARIQLEGADLSEAQLEGTDLSKAQLKGAHLSRAQLEGANLRGTQLRGANLREAQLKGADLRGAQLEGADLSGAQLERANLSGAQLEGAYLHETQLERAHLSRAQLERAHLFRAQLKGAYLHEAQLKEANLREAQLEGADLGGTQLKRAYLREAQLEGAYLREAQLEGAYLSGAQLDAARLKGIRLSGKDKVGPFLVDAQWGSTNLAVVDWSQVLQLGEEHHAYEDRRSENASKKDARTRLQEFKIATRANRQLSVALQGQGLNEDAVRFAYRANVLQRKVLWYQTFMKIDQEDDQEERKWYGLVGNWLSLLRQRAQRLGAFFFLLFLDVLAGYGYKPGRTLSWYFFVVLCFALLYAFFGHLPFWPDALVYSLTSFHGRGFLPGLNGQTSPLHHPLVVMAAFEAVAGLLVEISFIATFTQRYFGK